MDMLEKRGKTEMTQSKIDKDLNSNRSKGIDITEFWKYVLEQNAEKIRTFFCRDASVHWHCTNEHFTVEEFIRANCEYPGEWTGEVERIEIINDLIITITHVYSKEKTLSFHVTSFFDIEDSKIKSVDEYWADDGEVPGWRKQLGIGKNRTMDNRS